LVAALGWPPEHDRRGAAVASFIDLVHSASRRVVVSSFVLDDEAMVEPALILDELAHEKLLTVEVPATERGDILADGDLDADARTWAALRSRPDAGNDARYHGLTGPQTPAPLTVSAVETYLACPFKFFAQYVLRLDDETDTDMTDPRKQGQFVHEVFREFFTAWQARGHREITSANLDAAHALFAEIVESRVALLSDTEAALERTRLLGSPVAAGLGDIVFRMEAERQAGVVERLLEHRLDGQFEFVASGRRRTISLRGVADRLDLLDDGSIRLIDYKLSSAPAKSRALQLPVYGLCAEQRLQGYKGRRWKLGEAAYIAFRGAKRVTPLFTPRSGREAVLEAAQETLVEAVERIERGEFPPTPDDVFLCGFCSYSAVCRKDYVGDA
jgi:RecB family exonuclease